MSCQTFTRVNTYLAVGCPQEKCGAVDLLGLQELAEHVLELDPSDRVMHCRDCNRDNRLELHEGRWYVVAADKSVGLRLALTIGDGAQCPECGSLTKLELTDGDKLNDPGRELVCWCCELEARIVDKAGNRWARWNWPNGNGGNSDATRTGE